MLRNHLSKITTSFDFRISRNMFMLCICWRKFKTYPESSFFELIHDRELLKSCFNGLSKRNIGSLFSILQPRMIWSRKTKDQKKDVITMNNKKWYNPKTTEWWQYYPCFGLLISKTQKHCFVVLIEPVIIRNSCIILIK